MHAGRARSQPRPASPHVRSPRSTSCACSRGWARATCGLRWWPAAAAAGGAAAAVAAAAAAAARRSCRRSCACRYQSRRSFRRRRGAAVGSARREIANLGTAARGAARARRAAARPVPLLVKVPRRGQRRPRSARRGPGPPLPLKPSRRRAARWEAFLQAAGGGEGSSAGGAGAAELDDRCSRRRRSRVAGDAGWGAAYKARPAVRGTHSSYPVVKQHSTLKSRSKPAPAAPQSKPAPP
jgi:hypothetical protein